MTVVLLLSQANAATFVARTAKWEASNVYCAAYSGSGETPRTELESGAEPHMSRRNPVYGSIAMGTHEGWDTAYGVVHPEDAPGVVVGPYAFELSPLDRANDKGLPASQLALDLHTDVVGPKMHLDAKGKLLGPWRWNPDEKIAKQLPHVQRATVNAAAWSDAVKQRWAPAVVELTVREQWAVFGGAWLGKPVGGPAWETRESPMAGVELVRTWSSAPSTACGKGVKRCVALTVETRLADATAATTAVTTPTQPPPPGVQVHVWARQVTQVDAKTMRVYAWSQVGFQGQRDTKTDIVDGTATSVSCRPR